VGTPRYERIRRPDGCDRVFATRGRPGLALIESSDTERHLLPLYDERMRPQFHHSQKQGWNNDPNGMVYYDAKLSEAPQPSPTVAAGGTAKGEGRANTICFWQWQPGRHHWGNMYWGHSTSPDMIHWTEQRHALRSLGGEYTRTGIRRSPARTVLRQRQRGRQQLRRLADREGEGHGRRLHRHRLRRGAGLLERPGPELDLLCQEPHHQAQRARPEARLVSSPSGDSAATSAPQGHWVLACFDQSPDRSIGGNIAFYSSKNLKDWTLNSHLPGYFECPELFELPVDPSPF